MLSLSFFQNNLQFYVSDRSFLDKFAINSAGEVVLRRPLDYESSDSYHYQVMVTDGVSVSRTITSKLFMFKLEKLELFGNTL